MKEYELYVPLRSNCGMSFSPARLAGPITRNNVTLTGKSKRLGPALPGFRNNTSFL